MAKLGISTGLLPDDGNGDSLIIGATKINSNFDEIYNYFGDGTNLSFTAGVDLDQTLSLGNVSSRGMSVGVVTSTSFVKTSGTSSQFLKADGSVDGNTYLTAVSSGSRLTGIVTSIIAGTGITISGSTGSVTINSTAVGGGEESYWSQTATGIHTLSNVGIGTTNPTSPLTVKGNTSLETLSVSGVSTLTIGGAGNTEAVYFQSKTQPQASLKISQAVGNDYGVLMTFSSSDGETATIETDSNSNLIISTQSTLNLRANTNQTVLQSNGSSVGLFYSGDTKFQTIGAGVTVTGTTFTNQLSVSGVSTLTSNVSVGGTISVDGGVQIVTNNPTIIGTSGTAGEIKQIGGAPFFYDGSAWREFVLSSGTPVTVPADTEWDNVVFRATFDDDFTDAKFGATPVFVSAGSTIVGAAVTIGTGAFRNDGAVGSGVSYAYRSDYDFTGSWTIEFWIYHDSFPTDHDSIISQVSLSDSSGDWTLSTLVGASSVFFVWDNENNNTGQRLLFSVSSSNYNATYVDNWHHYALVREGNNGSLHFYADGVESPYTYKFSN